MARATRTNHVRLLRKLTAGESGQGMTEYAILAGTLVLAVVLTLLSIGTRTNRIFRNVRKDLNQVQKASKGK
jgi:Flp pilus assembly pilin Flp